MHGLFQPHAGIYALIAFGMICTTVIIVVRTALRRAKSEHIADIMRGVAEIFRWWRRPG